MEENTQGSSAIPFSKIGYINNISTILVIIIIINIQNLHTKCVYYVITKIIIYSYNQYIMTRYIIIIFYCFKIIHDKKNTFNSPVFKITYKIKPILIGRSEEELKEYKTLFLLFFVTIEV